MDDEEKEIFLKLRSELQQTNTLFLEEIAKNQVWEGKCDELSRHNSSISLENFELRTVMRELDEKNVELMVRCDALAADKAKLIELNHVHVRDNMALRNTIETYKKQIKALEGLKEVKAPDTKNLRKPLERKTWPQKK